MRNYFAIYIVICQLVLAFILILVLIIGVPLAIIDSEKSKDIAKQECERADGKYQTIGNGDDICWVEGKVFKVYEN